MPAPSNIGGVLTVDRRRAPRVAAGLSLTFPLRGTVITASALDLSESGMRVAAPAEVPRGTKLTLRLILPGETKARTLIGEIMWARRPVEGEKNHTFGLAFRGNTPEVTERLRQLVQELGDEIPEVAMDDLTDADEPLGFVDEAPAADPAIDPFSEHAHTSVPMKDAPVGPSWAADLQAAIAQDTAKQVERKRESRTRYEQAQKVASSGALDEAVKLLEQALTFTPEAGEVVEELGRVLYLKGNVVRAAELFDRALRLPREFET